MKSKKVKLFAWDFHGTLEQGTDVGFTHLMRDLAKSLKYDAKIELEVVRKHFGMSILDYFKLFFPKLKDEELLKLKTKLRKTQNVDHMKKYIKSAPFAKEVLSEIKKAGHKNIIVSTSSEKHIMRFLRVVGLKKYFDRIYGVDRHNLDGEFDIAAEKAEAIKGYAFENKIDVSKIVVIGDRLGDVDAGLLIGAKTFQYVNSDYPNIETKARYKIKDLREILKEI